MLIVVPIGVIYDDARRKVDKELRGGDGVLKDKPSNPSRYDLDVRRIYMWIKHQRKVMNAGGMKPERVILFEMLQNLAEKYKYKINMNKDESQPVGWLSLSYKAFVCIKMSPIN